MRETERARLTRVRALPASRTQLQSRYLPPYPHSSPAPCNCGKSRIPNQSVGIDLVEPMPHTKNSVFLDPSGKRWRAIRRATLAVGILSTLIALGLAISFVIPPILPNLQAAKSAVRISPTQNRLVVTRDAARKRADRQQLLAALTRKPAPPATHAERLPV